MTANKAAVVVVAIFGLIGLWIMYPEQMSPILIYSGAVLAALGIYLLPSIVAFSRNHHDRAGILILNLLLGATGVIWIVCLVWSLTSSKPQAPTVIVVNKAAE